jgi:hypothetical protein
MFSATHARARRKEPLLVARFYVNRYLIDVARNTVRVDRPPTIDALISQRHVDYFTH